MKQNVIRSVITLRAILSVSVLSVSVLSAASLCLIFTSNPTLANTAKLLTVEELRIEKATKAMPEQLHRFSTIVDEFRLLAAKVNHVKPLQSLVVKTSARLWREAGSAFKQRKDNDDRPLYWARLQLSKALKQTKVFKQLTEAEQHALLWRLELVSRGQDDINFDKKADIKILLTGFDPFFLDRNIAQSNPSGVVALTLDNQVLATKDANNKTITIAIETLLIPVRFADFDQGMIEALLTPYIKNKTVDMVLTVSMGRSDFDLERFPALRRSAKAPDNLNVLTGANSKKPLIPRLKNHALTGAEFVEFSLPVANINNIKGHYLVNDNHKVETLENGKFEAKSLTPLLKQTSVNGSGGGYLSNEISYRSILLRDAFQPSLPVGHIHTPRIATFEQQTLQHIVDQTKAIIANLVKTHSG